MNFINDILSITNTNYTSIPQIPEASSTQSCYYCDTDKRMGLPCFHIISQSTYSLELMSYVSPQWRTKNLISLYNIKISFDYKENLNTIIPYLHNNNIIMNNNQPNQKENLNKTNNNKIEIKKRQKF